MAALERRARTSHSIHRENYTSFHESPVISLPIFSKEFTESSYTFTVATDMVFTLTCSLEVTAQKTISVNP